MKNAKKLRK